MTDWLLANPHAGDGERNGDFWKSHLAEVGITDLRVCDLEDQGWVDALAPGDRLLAAGGDGSVNAAAKICLDAGATLAVLPSGTANDFFRNLGIENTPEAICEAVAENQAEWVDIAEYDDGIFLNVAHVGLGTMPARDANADASSKKLFGQVSYALSLVRRIFSRRGFRAVIRTDQATLAGRWLSIAVANGAYFGGGSEVPNAGITNGALVIVAIRPASIPGLLTAFVLTRLLGRPPRDNRTVVEVQSPRCRISTRQPKTVTVDGDVAGQTPFNASCHPGKLRVITGEFNNSSKSPDATAQVAH